MVITSRLLSDAHRYILRCLSTHRGVRHCTIFTSISEVLLCHYCIWLLDFINLDLPYSMQIINFVLSCTSSFGTFNIFSYL